MSKLTKYQASKRTREELANRFIHHTPHGDQWGRYQAIRKLSLDLAIAMTLRCPPSRELSLALTDLEQAMMWANAAIARNEKPTA